MKRGTPDHPKTLDLAEAIQAYLVTSGTDLPFEMVHTFTCGLLERLWHFTARYAASGLVATHSAQRIARAIGWAHEPDWLVRTMTKVGFLDDLPGIGLYVHDWHQHSDDAADKWLADKGLTYGNGASPRRQSKQVPTKSRPRRDKSRQSEPVSEPSSEPEPTNQPTKPPSHVPAPQTAGDDVLADGRAGGNGFSGTWGTVADRLAGLGASRWREAISEARECGCTAQLALSIIDFGKSNGYGVGAIVCRLAKARPTLPVDTGWPAEPPAQVEARKRAQSSSDDRRRQHAESLATQIIKSGRRAKKSDADIQAELEAAGLEWPR